MPMPRKWPLGHYVYYLCYPDGTPYYIGIGTGGRAGHTGRNKWANNVAAKIRAGGDEVLVKLYECSSREEAAAREVEEISYYGRRIDGSGILTNILPGGQGGASGSPFLSPLDRELLRSMIIEKRSRGAQPGNMHRLGKMHTEETKQKIGDFFTHHKIEFSSSERERRSRLASERNKLRPPPNSVRPPSEETKRKQSEIMKRRAAGEIIPTQKERRAAKRIERQRAIDAIHN